MNRNRAQGQNFKKFFVLLILTAAAPARNDVLTLSTAALPPPGYDHLPYANPAAPKGGALTISRIGTFDDLNPFITAGAAPVSIYQIWQPLFKASDTDSVTAYAELATAVDLMPGVIIFHLNPAARFSDGVPVTAADVVWTFQTLISQGEPFYAGYYAGVAGVGAPDAQTVVFHLKPDAGAELPLDIAEMYVLPKHFWAGRNFADPLLTPPIGSGPYRIAQVSFGSTINYTHVPNWWGSDLPSDKGFYNFGSFTELYFQSPAVALQAFKAGQVDAREAATPEEAATAYDFPAARDGRVERQAVPLTLPAGMRGLVMNTRRPLFRNLLVRKALADAFDFGKINQVFFRGAYARDGSFYFNAPAPGGASLPQAYALLTRAGWRSKNLQLVDAAGHAMRFEILIDTAADETIALAYAAMLQPLGITVTIRLADPATYQRRVQEFDFDMTPAVFPATEFPGAEQADYWSCAAARAPGSPNLSGACAPALDALIAAEIAAADPAAKATALHALDGALLAGTYVIPLWHRPDLAIAWWRDRVAKPAAPLQIGYDYDLWWAK